MIVKENYITPTGKHLFRYFSDEKTKIRDTRDDVVYIDCLLFDDIDCGVFEETDLPINETEDFYI